MFDTFDHPDMNVTAGARNVSTVPTQALTLLNNPFVLSEAGLFAKRIAQSAHDPESQVREAYRLALARPATRQEIAIGIGLITGQSLESFTHARQAVSPRHRRRPLSIVPRVQRETIGRRFEPDP